MRSSKAAVLAALVAFSSGAAAQECDRACILQITDQYLAAIVIGPEGEMHEIEAVGFRAP